MTNTKIFAIVLSLAIVSLLVLSGPAQALNLNILGDKGPHDRDEKVVFTATLDLDADDVINSISIIKDLGKNKEEVIGTFNPDGSVVSGLKGITIVLKDFGYGYASSGVYEITFDLAETDLSLGNNKLYLVADTSDGQVESKKIELVIKPATPKK